MIRHRDKFDGAFRDRLGNALMWLAVIVLIGIFLAGVWVLIDILKLLL